MVASSKKLKDLTQSLFFEVQELLAEPKMANVVTHGLNPLYGPLMIRPDLALITFQGGGADGHIQTEPPAELLYLNDPYKFGSTLRKYISLVGMDNILSQRSIAHAVIFPQAPTSMASQWLKKVGAYGRWREFSKSWTTRLLVEQQPKVMMVFGDKASSVLGIRWEKVERNHKQNHMTYGRAEWNGIEAIYCHHLSIGCPAEAAIHCLEEAKRVIGG